MCVCVGGCYSYSNMYCTLYLASTGNRFPAKAMLADRDRLILTGLKHTELAKDPEYKAENSNLNSNSKTLILKDRNVSPFGTI